MIYFCRNEEGEEMNQILGFEDENFTEKNCFGCVKA